jgi:hypothetical protein
MITESSLSRMGVSERLARENQSAQSASSEEEAVSRRPASSLACGSLAVNLFLCDVVPFRSRKIETLSTVPTSTRSDFHSQGVISAEANGALASGVCQTGAEGGRP